MAKPSKLEAYPQAFFEVLEQLQNDPERSITLRCESQKEAKDFRLMFYGFRKAYLAADMHKTASGYLDIDSLSCTLKAVSEGSNVMGWDLKIGHRDYSPLAQRLQEAVNEAKKRTSDPAHVQGE